MLDCSTMLTVHSCSDNSLHIIFNQKLHGLGAVAIAPKLEVVTKLIVSADDQAILSDRIPFSNIHIDIQRTSILDTIGSTIKLCPPDTHVEGHPRTEWEISEFQEIKAPLFDKFM